MHEEFRDMLLAILNLTPLFSEKLVFINFVPAKKSQNKAHKIFTHKNMPSKQIAGYLKTNVVKHLEVAKYQDNNHENSKCHTYSYPISYSIQYKFVHH